MQSITGPSVRLGKHSAQPAPPGATASCMLPRDTQLAVLQHASAHTHHHPQTIKATSWSVVACLKTLEFAMARHLSVRSIRAIGAPLLLTLGFSFVSAAFACETIAEMEEHRLASPLTADGYEKSAIETFVGTDHAVDKCLQSSIGRLSKASIYFAVQPGGGRGPVMSEPETDLRACLNQATMHRIFAPPPNDEIYVVKLDLVANSDGSAKFVAASRISSAGARP